MGVGANGVPGFEVAVEDSPVGVGNCSVAEGVVGVGEAAGGSGSGVSVSAEVDFA